MVIYIGYDYKCYTEPAEDRTQVETPVFDGKCKTYIEGFRFIPEGHEWKRWDGYIFRGETVFAWKDYSILEAAQQVYEESLAEIKDMTDALNLLGVDANG